MQFGQSPASGERCKPALQRLSAQIAVVEDENSLPGPILPVLPLNCCLSCLPSLEVLTAMH